MTYIYLHIMTYIYLHIKQEHGDLSKADKKRLCRILDCQKLSPEMRAHAVKNERLPLRTVVQVLFFEQDRDRGSNSKASTTSDLHQHDHHHKHKLVPVIPSQSQELYSTAKQTAPTSRELDIDKLKLGAADHHDKNSSTTTRKKDHLLPPLQTKRSDGKLPVEAERKAVRSAQIQQVDHQLDTGREIIRQSGSKLDAKKMIQKGSKSDHGRDKGKDR